MNKPLLALAGIALLGTAGVAGALFVAPLGGEEEAVRQAETVTPAAPLLTAGPGVTLWRWMDVSVLIPDDSGIRAVPDVIYFDDQGTVSREGIRVGKFDPNDSNMFSYALIDAKDGTIHSKQIREEHHAEMELVLSTVTISPFDPATAPWPYNGDPPAAGNDPTAELIGPWAYVPPDPGSGMYAEFVSGSGASSGEAPPPADCDRAWEGIGVRNGRSSGFIGQDARTGSICKKLWNVHPEDIASFQRFLDRAEGCFYQPAECHGREVERQ